MVLKVLKPGRNKGHFLRVENVKKFRDTLIAIDGQSSALVFLNSLFVNPFINYEIISQPIVSGTYKVRIVSEDSLGNLNAPGTDPEAFATIVLSAFTLPPRNLEFTVSGNNVTFTWEHSSEGAPDTYKFYGVQNGNVIDKVTALDSISGSLRTHVLNLADGDWKIVLEATRSGIQSENLYIVEFTTPETAQIPPKPGLPSTNDPNAEVDATNPFAVTGLELTTISVAKVKIRFLWLWGVFADTFNIYHNSGSGEVDFSSPAFSFSRVDGNIQEFTTTVLFATEETKRFKFVVRAEIAGNEEKNTDIYEIDVNGAAPDLIEDIALDSIL